MPRSLIAAGATLAVLLSLRAPMASRSAATPDSPAPGPAPVDVARLDRDVKTFLDREMAAHLGDIHTLNPPQARVVGALTTGEYTWGTFMRSLAAYGQLTGATMLAGRNLPRTIGDIGLVEARLGGTRFSQLYATWSLRDYGTDLSRNPVWQSLTPDERAQWMTLLDVTRFYDPVKKQVIGLPENYLGVASRIAAMSWQLGLLKDRELVDSLLDRAAVQFTSGALYADDALPAGRYDRYSNEYARYVWEAAQIADRKDLLAAVRPSLETQMRLWWDLVGPDGYGYSWGRSLGLVSYLDTLEIPGFLATNPEFRPAPLEEVAAEYHRAWQWLQRDFKTDRHLLSLFDFGRGNFSYISIDREWQQTVGAFGKLANAHAQLMKGLQAAHVTTIPDGATLPTVTRFESFRRGDRPAGVWVVRRGSTRFALPFTTGTMPGIADYLPAPHGLAGFAVPVEQMVPALVPFIELEDGRTIVAADGADAIEPNADGLGLRARWTRWAVVGGRVGERIEPGFQTSVEWRLDGAALVRTETLTAQRSVRVRRWRVAVPTTADRWTTASENGARVDRFGGRDGRLDVALAHADWPYAVSVHATGDSAAGRGAKGAVPLFLEFEAQDIALERGAPRSSTLWLRVSGD